MSFRDANVIVIDTSRSLVRAGIGLHELLKISSVVRSALPKFPLLRLNVYQKVLARVGLRRNASGDFANGTNGVQLKPASSSRISTLPHYSAPNAGVNDYLVGTQLDEALAAGQDILISWPFADGDVRDWTQAEAIWYVLFCYVDHPCPPFLRKYVIFNQLQRRRSQNESPVILNMSPGLSRPTYERICQLFFERFNVPGFAILERPVAQMYAGNSLTGVVVDIDEEKTDITPMYENNIIYSACAIVSVGMRDCRHYLAHLLKFNTSVMSSLSPPDNPLDPETLHQTLLELVEQIYEEGLIKVPSDGETAAPEDEGVTDIAAVVVAGKERAVIESGMKKKANAKASAAEQARAREIEALDLTTIQFRGMSVTLGKERHRFCEPLFDPKLLNGVPAIPPRSGDELPRSLQEVVGHAVNLTDADQRQHVWQGLLVTGDITRRVKGSGYLFD